jgi:hypothetical protein
VNSATEAPKIKITFPSNITLASTCTYTGTSGQLSSSLTCTATNSGADREYVLTTPFGGNNYATATANLQISLGLVTNPDVSGNPGSFTVATYLTEGGVDYLVDTATFSSITITTGTLLSTSVAASSTIAYDTAVSYSFSFTTQHRVTINGLINIVFPSTITITDSSAALSGCQTSLIGSGLADAACTVVSTTELQVTNLFPTAATGAIIIVVPGIRNQRFVGTSSSFAISTTDSLGNGIDSQSTGFTVTMLSAPDLQAVSIDNTDTIEINGAFSPYQIFITPQTPAVDTDMIVLQFPTATTFPTSVASLS